MGNNTTNNIGKPDMRLLVIDDEENMRHMLVNILKKSGYTIDTATNGHEGLKMIDDASYDFILCDLEMPNMGGMEFLKTAGKKLGNTNVIMMSAYGSIDTAVAAVKLGAYDFISKPFKSEEILHVFKKAEERDRLKKENYRLKEHLSKIEESYLPTRVDSFGVMVARSKSMQAVFKLSKKVANYDTTVLIIGESGTGKELIARGIHLSGKRAKMPLIPVNCGAIPENLLESELFGHKQGAFTGADRNKRGLFEEADGGTIFLDEIGELPLPLQVKLLRVLQESELRQVGDSKTKKIDVRVIAATAKDLKHEVKEGAFREDLFYRLNVLPINLPSLEERGEDVALLSEHFINFFNKKLDKNVKELTPAAMSILLNYSWPGNVRELENVIERAVVLAEEPVIHQENLPPEMLARFETKKVDAVFEGFSLKKAQKIIEKELIIKALSETGGNRTRAARLLEISHPSLLSKIKLYNITL